MRDFAALRTLLERLDGSSYRAYGELRGDWQGADDTPYLLGFDHVQGDPFAAPSRVHVRLPQQLSGFPQTALHPEPRRRALSCWLADRFARCVDEHAQRLSSGHSGLIDIDRPGQQLLQRSCIQIDDEYLEARFVVGLPAAGRRILGDAAIDLLCTRLPAVVMRSLCFDESQAAEIDACTRSAEDTDALRRQLHARGLVAFIGDDAVLPRHSGVDDRPMADTAIPFSAPDSLRVQLQTPNAGTVTGLGIPTGITLIVGGGFHGKSTLLDALARGVYDHRHGDGRERVVTDASAVTIRAESGRRTVGVDLSPFIGELPCDGDPNAFCTDDASGSTSQAANIVEAIEAGAHVLLVDEDTSATNFMIRDERMQQLIATANEPITPFVDRIRALYDDYAVSTILIMGGSGDYFDVADTVIAMESYRPRDVTDRAHAIAAASGSRRRTLPAFALHSARAPLAQSIDPRQGRRMQSYKVRGHAQLQLGTCDIDLSAVAQLVDAGQTRAIASAILFARQYMDGHRFLADILALVETAIATGGLDSLTPFPCGDLAMFRRHELAAAINRHRTLEVTTRKLELL